MQVKPTQFEGCSTTFFLRLDKSQSGNTVLSIATYPELMQDRTWLWGQAVPQEIDSFVTKWLTDAIDDLVRAEYEQIIFN